MMVIQSLCYHLCILRGSVSPQTLCSVCEGNTKHFGNKVGERERNNQILESASRESTLTSETCGEGEEKVKVGEAETNSRKQTMQLIPDPYRVCCPCQYTERGGRLWAEHSAPRRKSWPAGAWGWGTGLCLGEPEPSGRLGRLSSWPCWSRQAPGQWRWHPASAWHCCHKSEGSGGAKRPKLPLCKVLWCQHRSSLGGWQKLVHNLCCFQMAQRIGMSYD